ncbi:uncharacterized protein LOC141898895 [Tubulanus polymorphus]|uniref:uncharacterized protein LOC141898895 n=1 Tax=Tubulanus polymorphus TaxID=672921 RepID=UPI003DA2ED70
MCLGTLCGLATAASAGFLLLPYMSLLTLPMYGAFFGTEIVVRYAIHVVLHTLASAALPKCLVSMIPLLQLGIFVGLVSLPVNFIPWTIVALYDTVLWLTEPAWLIIEGWQIVYLCMVISKVLVQNIEENEFMFKGIILSIAGISYLMTAWLIPKTLFAESSVISG